MIAVAALTATFADVSAPVRAQESTSFTIRWSEQWGDDFPAVRADKFFVEDVTKRSGGRIKFSMFLHGQLGGGSGAMDGVQNGTIQMATVGVSFLSGVSPRSAALTLPFLFKDDKAALKAANGKGGEPIAKELEAKNIKLLAWYNIGWSTICNNKRPLLAPDDAKGLKIRVIPSPILVAEMTALGANPIPMNFTEVFTAMQNGTIDGFSSGISAVIDQKWHQVTKYCSITNDTWSPVAVMINRDFFNRLPPDLQEVVLSASRSAIAQSAVIYDEFNKSLIQNLVAAGVKMNEVPAATIENWRVRMMPIIAKARENFGEGFINSLVSAE